MKKENSKFPIRLGLEEFYLAFNKWFNKGQEY